MSAVKLATLQAIAFTVMCFFFLTILMVTTI
jgi:hypothetical protein